jgi:glutamate-1-semialdehyde 2,1-aminomutase
MFQFYLRAAGLSLSWVGTGRLIFSLDYGDADFAEVVSRFISAAEAMRRDGWWWNDPAIAAPQRARMLARGLRAEMLGAVARRLLGR